MRKHVLLLVFTLFASVCALAQVTTSSVTGVIKDSKGETLIGATIQATHEPTGSHYATTTNADGRFTIPNMRNGGPYTVTISYVGYQSQTFRGIVLVLGQPYVLNVTLETSGLLKEVKVTGSRSKLVISKTGAATDINSRLINTLPSISRSLTDLTRITPQASSTAYSFGGADPRLNNLQVDGANLNNNFGLNNDPTPGGGPSPISIDAFDEVAVDVAPYDVRQSGFTGAGIYAVTKSGTNTFHGTGYTYYRNQSFYGTHVGSTNIASQIANTTNQIYGASLGGPIIKNKLFFFVNGEYEKNVVPGVTYIPQGGTGSGTVTTTPVGDLKSVYDFVKGTYGYDPGVYQSFPNFNNHNYKVLGKLDWNINDIHKLTIRYSDFSNKNYSPLNGSSVPNGGGFSVTGRSGTLSRLPYNRFSTGSSAFENSNYGTNHVVREGSVQLNSNFSSKMSNQLIATYTHDRDTRFSDGGFFPTVDIFDGNGNNYISVGSDPFTENNDVINNIFNVTDNFTYYLGKHTITAGATYEYQKLGNMFMGGAASYYAYNSLSDFLGNKAPVYYAWTYSLVPGVPAPYAAELKIGQLGVYAQDEVNFSNFKLTYGVRIDKPIYLQDPIENPAVTALELPGKDGAMTHYSTGQWPSAQILVSPRVGFRWDALKDNSLIVRGGTGIFTGKIPFVFLTNMPTNSGMYQYGGAITSSSVLSGITFNPNPNTYAGLFPKTAGGAVPSNVVLMDPKFKFPSVFRSDLAVDKSLGNGFTLTLEGIYSKNINGVRMRNANLKNPTSTTVEGDLSRPRFVGTSSTGSVQNSDRYYYPGVTSAIVLENTNMGYSTQLSAVLTKTFTNGFTGSVAYTYTQAKNVSDNPGSQASSVWNSNPNVGTSNSTELGYTQNAVPHRITANIGYRFDYAKHAATTVSLFYDGENRGNYNFVVNGDLNGDGNSSTDLMYIPKNAATDINFTELKGTGYDFTPAQQAAAMEEFIKNSPYLRKHRGQFSQRNAALLPWYNRVDARILQDFYIETGANHTRHTLELSADILNLPNLLNKNWGIEQQYIYNNPLIYKSVDATGHPTYTWTQVSGQLLTSPFQPVNSTYSTWALQIGARYSF